MRDMCRLVIGDGSTVYSIFRMFDLEGSPRNESMLDLPPSQGSAVYSAPSEHWVWRSKVMSVRCHNARHCYLLFTGIQADNCTKSPNHFRALVECLPGATGIALLRDARSAVKKCTSCAESPCALALMRGCDPPVLNYKQCCTFHEFASTI
jgi:hypothetical protein